MMLWALPQHNDQDDSSARQGSPTVPEDDVSTPGDRARATVWAAQSRHEYRRMVSSGADDEASDTVSELPNPGKRRLQGAVQRVIAMNRVRTRI